MLKVLCVQGSYLPAINGVSLRTRQLFSPLVNAKLCEVHILVPKQTYSGSNIYTSNVKDYEIIEGIHVHRVRRFRSLLPAIRNICRNWNIDIIHVRTRRLVLYGRIAGIRKPLVLELGGLVEKGVVKESLIRFVYKLPSRLIVLANSAKKILNERYNIPGKKIKVIKNGIDIKKFTHNLNHKGHSIMERYGLNGKLVVGYVGRFRKWQGVQDLIQAVPKIICDKPDVHFLLVGDGPAFDYIKDLVNDLQLENKIILPGEIPPDEVPFYIDCMNVFVIPRPSTLQTETAIPLKVLEAMAAGKAIVATRVGALQEILDNRRTALLVKPGDVKDISEAIITLLTNRKLRHKLGVNARRVLEAKPQYRWDYAATQMFKVYQELQ